MVDECHQLKLSCILSVYLERVNGFEPSTLCLASTSWSLLADTRKSGKVRETLVRQ